MAGKDVFKYYTALNNEPDYPFQRDLNALPEIEYHNSFSFPEGIIFAFSPNPMSAEASNVFKRLALVFGQTYRRYLDLQKAEAQAREAQIEASLERVRAKAMAMHNTKDISDAVAIVFNELTQLKIEMDRCGIVILNNTPIMEVWSTPMTGKSKKVKEVVTGYLDYNIHPMPKEIYNAWQNKENFFSYTLIGEEIKNYYKKLEKVPEYNFPKSSHYPDQHVGNCFFFKEGYIFTVTQDQLSEDYKNIIHRFTKVFSLTYRRYRDLIKAEKQAREAQIEAALERVRSKAMAMHSSEDLGKTVDTFFAELKGLDVSPHRCGVGIVDGETRIVNIQAIDTNPDHETKKIVGDLKLAGHPVLDKIFKHWKTQKEYFPVLRGNEIVDYYKVMDPQVKFHDFADDEVQYGYYFYFNEGGVYAWTDTELLEQDLQIFRKYTSVLSLTYRRYLDLKDAETKTREAVKQASLDRIRGQIASMRKTSDLQQITPLIWNELKTLEVPFFRCGVFIVDEKKKHVQVYLTTPEGKPLAALDLDFDQSDLTRNTVASWSNNKVYQQHWNKDEFIAWAQEMMKLRQINKTEKYQGGENPPESLHLHFIPFAQGMLYVGHEEQLEKEKIDLVKSLAEAFSFAYARYEDFVVLEEAKERVEKALSDLKATQSQLVHAEKMASLGELTAGIAHEIQNPLNFVNNFSEVNRELIEELIEELNKGDLEEVKAIANDIANNEEKIKHHGKRADGIVKGMLQHSRTTSNIKEPTDLNELADEYLRLSYHGLRAKDKSFNADFRADLDTSLPKINVIPQDIGRVLLNLINNAFYACTEQSRNVATKTSAINMNYKPIVIVSTKKLKDKVEISVKDNGSGIPDTVKDKIFQPFFTTKPTGQGTGLGLSMSYDIITKGHGGALTVNTKTGEGTEFIIQLPV
ncbi:MAG: ATP-binding protein [Bacteroidales bacterium]